MGIKVINEDELLSYGDIEAKKIALELAIEAIKSSNPYNAVKNSLKIIDGKLVVKEKEFPIKGKIYVLGFGKAAYSMAKAVEEVLGELIEDGVIITKYGYGGKLKKIRVIEAGHPIPDTNSFKGALMGLELAKKVNEKDILIVLISGGGSALFTLPEEGISLEDKILTNKLLVKSGARIHEINIVRKHISRVKGGKLAKIVKGTLISLILSDVVGDPLEVIASGPTVKDSSTFYDAYRVLKNYRIWDKIPESIRRHILSGIRGESEETLKKELPNVYNFIIGSNAIACETAYKRALEKKLNAYILTTTLEGEAKDVALAIGSIIEEIHKRNRPFKKPVVLIAGGETTVTLTREEHGVGGPNQELALSISRKIRGLRNTAVIAIDTDGTDGPTDAAGGLVDSYTYDLLVEKGIDIDEFLFIHNSYQALRNAKALVFTGPTKTNVNSIVIAVVL